MNGMNQVNNKPLVSIVTPSYNQAQFIEDTINSVKNQDYSNIEHIIVDGCSTDSTLSILEKYDDLYNMKWVSEKDEGQADAINKGFAMAKGEIVGWLNSDDVYINNDVVTDIVNSFQRNEEVDILYGDGLLINENGFILKVECKPNFSYGHLLRDCYIMQPSVFFRREVIKDSNLNVNLNFGMDYEYWLRLGKKYNFKHVNRILAADRNHAQRKILAQRTETQMESDNIRKEYGQNYGMSFYLGRLFDKFISSICRLKGAIKLSSLYFKDDFVFEVKKDNFIKTLYQQLLKSNHKLL